MDHLCVPFLRGGLKKAELLRIYEALLLPRFIEERMLFLLRQNRIRKWFSGIGQEAISVGSSLALEDSDWILPLHRNLGVFTVRGVPLVRLFSQFLGKKEGYTKGRDRSFHFGSPDHGIIGMISHLGAQLAVADGLALAHKLRKERRAVLVFSGDGGTSTGDFHEALNLAAVWQLPVLFLVENNGYSLSTSTTEQYACKRLVDRGLGYGMEARRVDGNNVLSVYHHVHYYAEQIRKGGGPVLLEAMTFRMRGHEEASGTAYVPKALTEHWGGRDPIGQYELWLKKEGVLSEKREALLRKRAEEQVEEAVREAFVDSPPSQKSQTSQTSQIAQKSQDIHVPDVVEEEGDVYASAGRPFQHNTGVGRHKMRFVDAIREALAQGLERDKELVLMGQDIAAYGGVFKATEGFAERFGTDRVRNTPLCESVVIGAALGLAMQGMRAVVELQFADFVSCGFNQVVNNLAKVHYRWGQKAGVVLRLPTGAGLRAGPFHSQSNEAWFMHTPGLKVLYPSSAWDAKGLLLAALEDNSPCIFFEHKALYRSISEEIPTNIYTTEIGKARRVREGTVASIITYGMGVHWALEAVTATKQDVEIIDLRTLLPWDKKMVAASVCKTSRALVLHEACLTAGVGAEVAAWIGEHCFEHLDAAVLRLGAWDTPVPYSAALEDAFLPKSRLKAMIMRLIDY